MGDNIFFFVEQTKYLVKKTNVLKVNSILMLKLKKTAKKLI